MSSALVIRIIGGVCGGIIGTYISGKIYEFIYKKKYNNLIKNDNIINESKPPSIVNPDNISYNKYQNVHTFQDILQIELNEHINNKDIYDYEYDNTSNVIEENNKVDDFEDYYLFFSSVARENN